MQYFAAFTPAFWKYFFILDSVGDCPWDQLSENVKQNVNEYYWVHNLENYDEVYRAIAFFIFKYKPQFLSSRQNFQ